ncbi:MAG: glycosyltransferase family 2 protein [Candidatus Omnitrophota bacterium]
MGKNIISVIVHTLNEEKNIRNCLESVKWADEIILVDMYSDDATVKIAREYTDKIYFFERKGYADPARQFGLDQAAGDWLLLIDADEMVPPALKNKLVEIAQNDLGDAVRIPHNNYFFGKHMEGARWGALQDYHDRFVKRGFASFPAQVHTHIRIKEGARVYTIKDPGMGFVHFNYTDMEHFLRKFNQYTTIEAGNMFDALKTPPSLWKVALGSLREIFGRFIKHQGYKDGLQGFLLSGLMGLYPWVVHFKYRQMRRYQTKDIERNVRQEYATLAEKIISEYHQK